MVVLYCCAIHPMCAIMALLISRARLSVLLPAHIRTHGNKYGARTAAAAEAKPSRHHCCCCCCCSYTSYTSTCIYSCAELYIHRVCIIPGFKQTQNEGTIPGYQIPGTAVPYHRYDVHTVVYTRPLTSRYNNRFLIRTTNTPVVSPTELVDTQLCNMHSLCTWITRVPQ